MLDLHNFERGKRDEKKKKKKKAKRRSRREEGVMEDGRRSLIHIHQAYKTPEKVHLGFFDRTGENKPCLSTQSNIVTRQSPQPEGGG